MRFIVCARSREDGETYVVDRRSYPNKDAAIAALGRSSSLPELEECDLYVLDLDDATSVVLVHPKAADEPEPPVSEPADRTAGPAASLCTSECSDAFDAPLEPVVAAEVEAVVLDDGEIGERLQESDLWSLVESVSDEPGFVEPVDVPGPEVAAPWWVDGAEADVVRVTFTDFSQEAIEAAPEDVVAESTALTDMEGGASESGTGADHADRIAQAELFDASDADPQSSDSDRAGYEELGFSTGTSHEIQTELPSDARLDAEPIPDSFDDVSQDLSSDMEHQPEESGLPPVFDMEESAPSHIHVDFDAWACTDCVFTSTCDRSEDDSPSACGSFQWRPE